MAWKSDPDGIGGTVSESRDSGYQGGGGGGQHEGGEHEGGYMGMSPSEITNRFGLSTPERSMSQRIGDLVTKALVQGLSHNVIAKNIQKAANLAGIDIDIEGAIAKALTSVRAGNPDIADEAAQTQALKTGLADAIDTVTAQGSEANIDDWLTTGLASSFEEAQIDPVTGESTAPVTPAAGSWDDFVSQFFGTPEGLQSMEAALQGQADYTRQQVADWRLNRGVPLNDYTAATEKQGGLLDDLIDQSREGTGLFSPVKFQLAGQEIAFVPRAQREQAAQLAGFGQTGLGNMAALYGQQALAADETYNKMMGASPFASRLAYLDQLRDLAKTGEGLSLARDTLTQQGETAAADRRANEPGILDYVHAISSLF